MRLVQQKYFLYGAGAIAPIKLPLRRKPTLAVDIETFIVSTHVPQQFYWALSNSFWKNDQPLDGVFIEPQRHKLHGQTLSKFFITLCAFVSLWFNCIAQTVRTDILLNNDWRTIADQNKSAFDSFQKASFNDKNWVAVDVPHNWDQYEGYRRMLHGNHHGYAWYRKRFRVKTQPSGKRYFLFFEGVGSYATVWLNGKQVGLHAGGRTTFTLDVTNAIQLNNRENVLAVRADHPANIKNLPWVCGGCSDERGFSEGSQPMGIFRPVHLVITNDIRVEPFGVHVWNDTTVSGKSAKLYYETEVKNYSNKEREIVLSTLLVDIAGKTVNKISHAVSIEKGGQIRFSQSPSSLVSPTLWSLGNPYLYTVVTQIFENGKLIDQLKTPYGIRWISWPVGKNSKQFLLNGKAVFINGIAEYEHSLGNSHAFTEEEIRSRVMQIKGAGFNAFRDAHQPHNLRYQSYWDSLGILWWPQMSAHIWFDSPDFRNNFKTLLTDWVKERRNSASLVLWGLQNESKLPADFARECTDLIRQLDPTTSSQRLVTTCNGGDGTDWDVPQNWTGTYGGDPSTYGNDIKKQILVGEYGAWRTLGLHSEEGSFQSSVYSEERMTQVMETKIKFAETARDSAAGHFMWLFSSHDNPGRVQGGEGFRESDRIGPVNYKGLLTSWEEPLDVYYMYRSNYVSKEKEPMVYIVSHTWPSRWTTTGKKNNIVVYSNCDEVELFNDVHSQPLGKEKRSGIGTHFQWDNVDINYNVLYAVGYVNGKEAAIDYIVLNHLPQSPHFSDFFKDAKPITKPQPGYQYLYRVNCGGGDYVDENGNKWTADRERINNTTWGSVSWAKDFPGIAPFFASQQRTFDPINGTKDWKLFQTFRYSRDKLKYYFPLKDGEYLIELYFTEPWSGTGGGMNCTGWRLFDVAINGKIALKNLDIWKESGHDGALKKIVKTKITGGQLVISFPRIASGQAIISAIAIATLDKTAKPAPSPQPTFTAIESSKNNVLIRTWLDLGDEQFINEKTSFCSLPPELFGAARLMTRSRINDADKMPTMEVTRNADVFVAIDTSINQPSWLKDFAHTKSIIQNDKGDIYVVYKKRFTRGEILKLGHERFRDNEMYLVMAQPASNIDPPYDLKPVASYKAPDAKLRGPGIIKEQIDGKERVLFRKASGENVLEWNFSVGVADMYSFTLSYNNPKIKTINGKLQLLSADGSLLKEEQIVFTPTQRGKSNYIMTTTGTMINAGHYKLKLSSKEAEDLTIGSLDVQ